MGRNFEAECTLPVTEELRLRGCNLAFCDRGDPNMPLQITAHLGIGDIGLSNSNSTTIHLMPPASHDSCPDSLSILCFLYPR
jgi:hypothetical protein